MTSKRTSRPPMPPLAALAMRTEMVPVCPLQMDVVVVVPPPPAELLGHESE